MGNGFFNIGVSALSAAQTGLVTTGHNIANANTDGYHRQSVVQSAAAPQFSGGGFLGQGVAIETVRRAYSDFLDGQVARAQAQAGYYTAFNGEVSRIDNLLAEASSGVAPVLEEFFAGLHELAADPSGSAPRQALISTAFALVSTFNVLDGQLAASRDGVNAQVTTTVAGINAYARQIADLNGHILVAQVDPDQPPNDLLDQRDALVEALNQLVGATVVRQDDGSFNVFVGNGQSLVLGRQAFELSAVPSLEDPQDLDIAYRSETATVRLSALGFQSGTLGGLLAFRSGPLAQAQGALGRLATAVAADFNARHRLGQDLNGSSGQDFFAQPGPVVISHGANAGSALLAATVADVGGLTTSDYRVVRTAGGYQVTRLEDGWTSTYAGLPQTVDGVAIDIASGTAAVGDSFLVRPTRNAAGQIGVTTTDPGRIAAALPISTAAGLANTGSAVILADAVNGPPPVDPNLQQTVTITFTGSATFDVVGTGTGNPSGLAYSSGAPISFNGWSVTLSGVPAAGDTFTVSSNTGGGGDNRNALQLAALQNVAAIAGGTVTYSGAYGDLVGLVGAAAQESDIAAQAQNAILDQSRETQQGLSGVNLDEEAANLLRYQQAYQAAGKMIQIGSTLFDTLLEITGS